MFRVRLPAVRGGVEAQGQADHLQQEVYGRGGLQRGDEARHAEADHPQGIAQELR